MNPSLGISLFKIYFFEKYIQYTITQKCQIEHSTGLKLFKFIYLSTKALANQTFRLNFHVRSDTFRRNYFAMPRSGGQRTNFQYYRAQSFEIYAKMFIKYVRLNMASKDVRQIQHGDAKWTLRGEWRSAAEIAEHCRTGDH